MDSWEVDEGSSGGLLTKMDPEEKLEVDEGRAGRVWSRYVSGPSDLGRYIGIWGSW
jgi:hypothetical protein